MAHDGEEFLRERLRLAADVIDKLAEQQAMTDDWYIAPLALIRDAGMTDTPPTFEARLEAAELQDRAEALRDARSDTMHRQILTRDHGWVEIQAEYLSHLLDRTGAPKDAKLPIIGRELALMTALARKLRACIAYDHNTTSIRDAPRGSTFEVHILEGSKFEPTGRIARVTVELDRVEQP